jgi:hypothetical protein
VAALQRAQHAAPLRDLATARHVRAREDKVKRAGGTPALLKPVNDGQQGWAYRNSMADLPDAPDSPGAETDYDSLVFYWPPRATRRTLCRQGASAAAIWGCGVASDRRGE